MTRIRKVDIFDVDRPGWLDSDLFRQKTFGVTVEAAVVSAGADGRKIIKAGTPVGVRSSGMFGPAVKALLVTGTVVANRAILWLAKKSGVAGNSITVTLQDPGGNNVTLLVSVTGSAITVRLATGSGGAITSTAAQVIAAVNAYGAAAALVLAANYLTSNGTGVMLAQAATNLAGGFNCEFLTLVDCEVTEHDAEVPVIDWGRVVSGGLPYVPDAGIKEQLPGITFVE